MHWIYLSIAIVAEVIATSALWSGIGIALIATIGLLVFKQTLDAAALCGIGLIVSGVVVLNVFSKSVAH